MTTALRIDWRPVEGGLPEDLSWYIGKKTLVKLILEAIDEGGLAGAGGDNVATEAMAFQPALLLTLLTYCYATGVYASIDIELGLRHDQMIRYLCANACPGFQVIHSFRRYNRTRIYRCLSMVLRRVWELRFCGEDANPMEDISYFAASLGKLQAQTPVPDFETEAERRIACGVRADSMAMDL